MFKALCCSAPLLLVFLLSNNAFLQGLVASSASVEKELPEYRYPKISGMGKVAHLPEAAQQPRSGSKVVVDLIKGGDAEKLNPGIEKVTRFVNIYAGAGKESAAVSIAVVLHGDATLICLKPDDYRSKYECDNPNLDCIRKLREAGVEIYVCGQSLVGKGFHPDEVIGDVDVAVSAMNTLVNLQADGYAFVLLGK
ncbi:MAG: DsrE family protein [Planctomycetota bacterium]|nr:DsrE family protein [Planctomycetota bacterium]